MILGCHQSIAKGFSKAALEAVKINANTFQFFTRNPRGGKAKDLDPNDIAKLRDIMEEHNFGQLLAHAPYTMNMAASKPEVYDFAKIALKSDLERLENLPCDLYNFHPGSHVGQGLEVGIEKIVAILNETLTGEEKVSILLEAMSGKGTEIGFKFEHLRDIIDRVNHKHLMGVCLDTCHLYSAGYDIVNDLDGVLAEFDRIVGLDRLKAIHLNDSKVDFASNKDRHEIIGEGTIGSEALSRFITHEKLKHLPFNLETPNDMDGYKKEIEFFRSLKG